MKKDHAFIKDGVFQRLVPKNSVGDPVLPDGVKILPVAREPQPTYEALEERLEEDGGKESNGTWLIGWTKVPLTEEEADIALAASLRKIWLNGEAFLDSFTLQEQAAISLSQDPIIAALRLKLCARQSEIWSDDPLTQMGLNALVQEGVISAERKTEITTP